MKYSIGSGRWATTSLAFILTLFVLVPDRTCAQPPDTPAPAPAATTVEMPRNGVPGVWMPMTTFRQVTADVQAFRLIRDLTVPDLERLLALERAQSADLRAQITLFEETERVCTAALDTSTAQTARAEERLATVRRRRPWLFVTGVLTGVLVVVLPVALTR